MYSPVRAQVPSGCCTPSAKGLQAVEGGLEDVSSLHQRARHGGFLLDFFFVRGDGEEVWMLRLGDRTLHLLAGGRLGTGLRGPIKAEKTSCCHSPFRLGAAG